MGAVHIFVATDQPATRYELDVFDDRPPVVLTNEPDTLLYCASCGRRMPASTMIAHAYYDGTYFFCREKEYGRSPEFPFEYRHVCKGTAWTAPSKDNGNG